MFVGCVYIRVSFAYLEVCALPAYLPVGAGWWGGGVIVIVISLGQL